MSREASERLLKRLGLYGAARRIVRTWRHVRSLLTRGRRIRNYFASHPVRKLQIGCGLNALEGWLNTDFNPRVKGAIFLDVRKRFPLADAQWDYVFSEHLIEHLEYRQGAAMLRECFRVLRPGGRICIATPDLRFLIDLGGGEKTSLQERYISWQADQWWPDIGIHRDVFAINAFFRKCEHEFIYDFAELRDTMARVGFTEILRVDIGQSGEANLQGVISHGRQIPEEFNRLETFVVEAVKPADGSNETP